MKQQTSNYDLVADLEANIAHAARIATLIDDWEGPPSSSGGGGHTAVGNSNPTAATVLAKAGGREDDQGNTTPDTWHGTPNTILIDSAHAHLADLDTLRQIAARMNARRYGTLSLMQLDEAKSRVNERTTPSTVGFCEGCDRSVDGTTEYDSLIAGLEGSCRKAFQRFPKTGDPGGDRRAFIEQRRRETAKTRRHAG